MSDFFFARQNDDGTYGEPVRLTGVKSITITSPDPVPDRTIDMFKGEFHCEMPLTYDSWKRFVWAILNLKQCKKRLVSKNIWRGEAE